MCQRDINERHIFLSGRGGCNALKAGQIGKGCYVHKKCDTGGG